MRRFKMHPSASDFGWYLRKKVGEHVYFCLDVTRSYRMYTGVLARIEWHYLLFKV